MDVSSELKHASLENLENDPSFESQNAGRIWRNHADDEIRCMMNSKIQTIPALALGNQAAIVRTSDKENSHIGEIRSAMVTESVFQQQTHAGWVLADGRNVSGSTFATLTGSSNIPDLRGIYLRGKDHGRGQNPDGDLAVGTFQDDTFLSHGHTIGTNTNGSGGSSVMTTGLPNTNPSASFILSSSSGGNETRPKSVTVNFFIRIN